MKPKSTATKIFRNSRTRAKKRLNWQILILCVCIRFTSHGTDDQNVQTNVQIHR